DRPPARLVDRVDPERHLVRVGRRTPHLRRDLVRGHLQVEHLPLAGVGPAARQPPRVGERLQEVDEAPRPPLRPDRAALRARPDALAHQPLTASGDRRSTSRSSATDSSVSQSSPVPTIDSARAFLRSIISSTRSSIVPTQMNLRTWTLRVCPMRNARSVAWSSTAGFHQRSTCTTWLAAVSVRPVPAALRDKRKTAGSSSFWNRWTSSSRARLDVPPCSHKTGRSRRDAR